MVEHICHKCHKIFDKKSTYNYHINRKITCAPPPDELKKLEEKILLQKNEIEELKKQIQTLFKLVELK